MVTLLAFNVKIENSILKYVIAEESSNIAILGVTKQRNSETANTPIFLAKEEKIRQIFFFS